jgi:type IV pilus assembly protein PilO
MDISISKLPWYGQLGAFVLLAAASIYGFYTYYVSDAMAEITLKKTHLSSLKADVNKGLATARRLNEFQSQVTDLERRLDSLKNVLPEQKDVADTLRRIQGLATQSNLQLLKFTPIGTKQQPLYLEVPYRIEAEGSYHNLGLFFDRVSKFPRIINVGDISISARPRQDPNSTIIADCTATTLVLQEAGGRGGRGAPPAR